MKFTLNWLKEFLDTDADLNQICETLTEIGLEVEEVINKSAILEPFRTVHVLEVRKHPDADRLNICKVKSIDEEFELVCGAPNVKSDMKAILAPLNSIVPANGMKVKKVKIRGVESIGMLCSAAELDLGTDSDGIIELPNDVEIGTKAVDALGIDGVMIEIAITPNRGDCLGVYGIARDLAAAGLGKLKTIETNEKKGEFKSDFNCEIKSDLCSELNFIEIKNVKNSASPKWLKSRLEAIGMTPKSAIVDVTNYIAYTFAQPLHAYDAKKLNTKNISADINGKSKFSALNDNEYELDNDDLVIKDGDKVIALAGIIGGTDTSTELDSDHILLEAGNFSDLSVSKSGRKYQIDTDSRYRFERKIDALAVKQALNFAKNLIVDICGGQASEPITAVKNENVSRETFISFTKINKIAAYEIGAEKITEILNNLGFEIISKDADKISVKIPSWRNDISIEEDLVEEILRISGFSNIPYIRPEIATKIEKNHLDIDHELSVKKLAASLGLNEVVSWSFLSEKQSNLFGFKEISKIQNPISNDLAIMRKSLIPNLVEIALNEQKKQVPSVEIFEYGRVFNSLKAEGQNKVIAALRMGPRNLKEIHNDDSEYNFYDIKEDFMQIAGFYGLRHQAMIYNTENIPEYLHKKRAVQIYLGKNLIGNIGELHPYIAKKLGLKQRVNIFEIFIDNIPPRKRKNKILEKIDLLPVNRDFCFILDKNIPAEDIRREIFKCESDLVEYIRVFDLYEGEKLGENKKSLAFNVVLQPRDKTLTGDELEAFNQKVIEKICQKFSAKLP